MSESGHLLVMAGGTGGHVFPALAVAQELAVSGTKISWLGTAAGLEARVVPQHGIALHEIRVQGLRGKGLVSWLFAPFKLAAAIWQSVKVIKQIKPDCVLGMGGFASGPGGLAAWLTSTPIVVHEQNAVVGLTNQYLAKLAKTVLTGFPNVARLPAHARWVGNPVRKDITATQKQQFNGRAPRVLVIGGSQGAHSLNQYLPEVFKQLETGVEIWHQAGRGRSQALEASYQDLGLHAKVSEFIEDMAAAYAWADLLICRAGAMTIAEVCAAGLPSVLVPYPNSAGDHQTKNAQALVQVGAAIMLQNSELQSPDFVTQLKELLVEPSALSKMGAAAQILHKPDALQQVCSACEEYLHA